MAWRQTKAIEGGGCNTEASECRFCPPPSRALTSLRRVQQFSSTPFVSQRTRNVLLSPLKHRGVPLTETITFAISVTPHPAAFVLDTPTYIYLSMKALCVRACAFVAFQFFLMLHSPLTNPFSLHPPRTRSGKFTNSCGDFGILNFQFSKRTRATQKSKKPLTPHIAQTQTRGIQALPAQTAQPTGQVRSYSGR